ncbi:Halomucin [Bienertia sinuspersici]
MFIFHCILKEDKRSLLHHAIACFHASLVIFKDWQEKLALRDYKFVESAVWVRVEDKKGSGYGSSSKIPGVFLGLENGTTKWVDIRYERVFIFCKNCGMIGHKETYCSTPIEKAKMKIWETISNLCNEGLKGIPQNKTTTLDLRSSVKNFTQNKSNGNSDSFSSSKEDGDEDPTEDEEPEESNEDNDGGDPDEEEGNNTEGHKDSNPREKRPYEGDDTQQESSSNSSNSSNGDLPSKKRKRALADKFAWGEFATHVPTPLKDRRGKQEKDTRGAKRKFIGQNWEQGLPVKKRLSCSPLGPQSGLEQSPTTQDPNMDKKRKSSITTPNSMLKGTEEGNSDLLGQTQQEMD